MRFVNKKCFAFILLALVSLSNAISVYTLDEQSSQTNQTVLKGSCCRKSGKNFYGAIYAKSIVVRQNTKITWVPFVPVQGAIFAESVTSNLNYVVDFRRMQP